MERITEILPDYDFRYPSEKDPDKYDYIADMKEYFRRVTDRIPFTAIDLMKYDKDRDEFILLHLPSEKTMKEIMEKLDRKEEAAFKKEMQMLLKVATQAKKEHEAEALKAKADDKIKQAKKNMENFLDPDIFEDVVEPADELDGFPPLQPAY